MGCHESLYCLCGHTSIPKSLPFCLHPHFPKFQACFVLTLAQVFSHMDLVTDSECFYTSIMNLLNDSEEKEKVNQLILWWNRYFAVYLWPVPVLILFKKDRSFPCTLISNICHPKTVLWLGSTKNMPNTTRELRLLGWGHELSPSVVH